MNKIFKYDFTNKKIVLGLLKASEVAADFFESVYTYVNNAISVAISSIQSLPNGQTDDTLRHNGEVWQVSDQVKATNNALYVKKQPSGEAYIGISDDSFENVFSYLSHERLQLGNSENPTDLFIDKFSNDVGNFLKVSDNGLIVNEAININSTQYPSNIRFVSPSFTQSGQFYNSIGVANNGFTGTIIVYQGTYNVGSLDLGSNILAIGKVTINGTVKVNSILNVSGSNLSIENLVVGNTSNVYFTKFNLYSITNFTMHGGGSFINVQSCENVTLQNYQIKLYWKGNINTSLTSNVGSSSEVYIQSDYIRGLNLGGDYKFRIISNLTNSITIGGSVIAHLSIKNIETTTNLVFGSSSKINIYHSNILLNKNSYILLNDETTVKLTDSYIKGNANAIILGTSYNQLVVKNSRIINENTNGYSIETSNLPCYVCQSQANVNLRNTTQYVESFTIDNTNLINELYF